LFDRRHRRHRHRYHHRRHRHHQVAYQRQFGEDDYAQVVIFPEGTTTNGKALITFHQGAFVPGTHAHPPARVPYLPASRP
jgi:1-acyl-sn-glycerol-3-phosphate acyltransferase